MSLRPLHLRVGEVCVTWVEVSNIRIHWKEQAKVAYSKFRAAGKYGLFSAYFGSGSVVLAEVIRYSPGCSNYRESLSDLQPVLELVTDAVN